MREARRWPSQIANPDSCESSSRRRSAPIFGSRAEQGLTHQLLASIPATEAATTNYDTLFENAWNFRRDSAAVLPRSGSIPESRWLLKLHGTVTDPANVVLTRDDYMRMDREGAALSGLVQALLITKRMLFVGYSLTDDRFHRIAHDVRSAIGAPEKRPGSEPFGVALSPQGRQSMKELWQGDVDILDMGGGEGLAEGSRRITIFLDYLVAHADDPAAYLKDPMFQALWTQTEKELARRLADAHDLAEAPNAGPAAESVARALRRFVGRARAT